MKATNRLFKKIVKVTILALICSFLCCKQGIEPLKNEKDALVLGFCFKVITSTNLAYTLVKARTLDNSVNFPFMPDEVYSAMCSKMGSLGIDFFIPAKFDDKYLKTTDLCLSYIELLSAKLSNEVSSEYNQRVCDMLALGMMLGHVFRMMWPLMISPDHDTIENRKKIIGQIEEVFKLKKKLFLADEPFDNLRHFVKNLETKEFKLTFESYFNAAWPIVEFHF